jgi:hypothetical protein
MDEEIELERDSNVIMKLNPEEEALYNEIEIAPAPRRRAPPRPTPRSFRSRMEPEEPQEGLDAFMNPHKQSAPPPPPDEEYPEEMYEDEDDYDDDEGGGYHQQQFRPPQDQPSSGYKSVDEEKADLLNKLTRLEKKGFTINKKLSMYSPVEDIRSEVKRITYSIEVDQSVKFSRRMLIACVTGLEFLNEKYSPLDIHLKGWSESVMENVNDYDQVFEELYAKYRTKMQVAPEIKLILMLSGSAMMYHLTSTMFKAAIPNVNDVLKQNPELVKNMVSAVQSTAANNMAAAAPQPSADGKYEMQGPGIDISSLMGNIMMPPPPPMSTSAPVYNPEPEAGLPDDDDVSDIVSEKGDAEDDEDQVKEVNVKPKARRSSRKKKNEINL